MLVLSRRFYKAAQEMRKELGAERIQDVIFKQERRGQYEKPFTMYKLKTMHDLTDQQEMYSNDSQRSTALGEHYRENRTDEIPQLINVFLGEIDFVGPRAQPNLDEYKVPEKYSELTKYPPGLFTVKQLAPPHIARSTPDQNYFEKNYAECCRIELKYMQNRTFFTDLKLIFQVVRKLKSEESIAANPDKKSATVTAINPNIAQAEDIQAHQRHNNIT